MLGGCRICGGEDLERFLARELLSGSREPFPYRLCASCGCLQIEQVPPRLARYYTGPYYAFEPQEEVLLPGWLASMALDAIVPELLEAFLGLRPVDAAVRQVRAEAAQRARDHYLPRLAREPTVSLLDVGCGSGAFLAELERLGAVAVCGVDPFLPEAAHTAVPVHRGPLDEVEGRFDIITFHHSFEHLADPIATLTAAADRLAPGGEILLRLPVVDGCGWARWGPHWAGLEAPRHLYLHSRRSLERIATQCGLGIRSWSDDACSTQWIVSAQHADGLSTLDPGSIWTPGPRRVTRGRIRRLRAEWSEARTNLGPDQVVVRLESVHSRSESSC